MALAFTFLGYKGTQKKAGDGIRPLKYSREGDSANLQRAAPVCNRSVAARSSWPPLREKHPASRLDRGVDEDRTGGVLRIKVWHDAARRPKSESPTNITWAGYAASSGRFPSGLPWGEEKGLSGLERLPGSPQSSPLAIRKPKKKSDANRATSINRLQFVSDIA